MERILWKCWFVYGCMCTMQFVLWLLFAKLFIQAFDQSTAPPINGKSWLAKKCTLVNVLNVIRFVRFSLRMVLSFRIRNDDQTQMRPLIRCFRHNGPKGCLLGCCGGGWQRVFWFSMSALSICNTLKWDGEHV